MRSEQLRQALTELNGERSAEFVFGGHGERLVVRGAMLVPNEADGLVKVTDGQSIYIIEADRIAWIRIGLSGGPLSAG